MADNKHERNKERVALGLCSQASCGARREHYAYYCDRCAIIQRRRARRGGNYLPWRPGGKGERPKVPDVLPGEAPSGRAAC